MNFGPQDAPQDYRIANRHGNPNWNGVKAWFDEAAASVQNTDDNQANQVWSTPDERTAWKQQAETTGAQLAAEKHEEYLQWWADQTDDYLDFLGIRGDRAL